MKKNVKYFLYGVGAAGVIVGAIYLYKWQIEGVTPVQLTNSILQAIPMTNNNSPQITTAEGAINNATNMIASKDVTWQGEIDSPSTKFKSFKSLDYNYRATILQLTDYYNGETTGTPLTTIQSALKEWDGGSDNDWQFVCNTMNIDPSSDLMTILNDSDLCPQFLEALSQIEQGNTWQNENIASVTASASNALNLV